MDALARALARLLADWWVKQSAQPEAEGVSAAASTVPTSREAWVAGRDAGEVARG
jgi:hypothetical protein